MDVDKLGPTIADRAAKDYLDIVFPAVADLVSGPIESLCIMYLALCGFQAFKGSLSVHDFFKRIVMITLVFATINWDGLGGIFYRAINKFLTDFGTAVFDAEDETMPKAFYKGVLCIGEALLKKAGTFSVGQSLQAIVLLVVNVLFLGLSMAVLIFSKLGLAVTMSLCPIFMGFMIFPATRQWAYNWLSMILNFCFMYILTMAIIRLSFAAFQSTFDSMKALGETGSITNDMLIYFQNSAEVYGLLLIMVIIIVFLLQVKSWAAALSGGSMIQTVGGAVAGVAMMIARVALTKNPAALMKGIKKGK